LPLRPIQEYCRLLQDIAGMGERGASIAEIARKTGLTQEYVRGVSRLIEKGEQRLLRSVESGSIPLSDAVEISESEEHEVQAALASSYERGLLKCRKLLIARKVVDSRRHRGKGLATVIGQRRECARLYSDQISSAFIAFRQGAACPPAEWLRTPWTFGNQ
jgi:ParB family chromosome partitioning protein